MAKCLRISGIVILALSGCICTQRADNQPEVPERMVLYYDIYDAHTEWTKDFNEIFVKTVNENIEEFLKKGFRQDWTRGRFL